MLKEKNNVSQLEDEVLLHHIQNGSAEAFSELVARHTNKFYSVSYRFTANQEDAEDIVQDAFIKLWNKPKMWDKNKKAKFTTWFYKVVINICLDYNKKLKHLPLPEDMEITDEKPIQDKIIDEKHKRFILERSIRELPERQQIALNLCFYEGLSNQEAANIIGINLKALQSLLMRAKASLKTKIKKYYNG